MSTPPQVEKELQRLRRLPENRICPNCQKKDGTFGFQAVCMAYKTFICGDCKSAHQSFSHRCKSVSMSIWNMMEVQSLEERNNGGNQAATHKWVAGAPESMRPSPDSHVNEKKAFIDRAYNKKEWESASPPPCENAKSVAPQPPTRSAAPQNSDKRGVQKTDVAKEPQAGARSQAAMVNLLDDDSFSSPPVAAVSQVAVNAPASSCNLLDDQFFSPETVPQNNAISTGGTSGSSAFPFVSGASNDTPGGSAFSFIAASQGNPQPNQPTGQVSFDPFATPGVSAPTQQQQQLQQQQLQQQQLQQQSQPSSCMNAGVGAWQQQQQQQPAWIQQGNMGCPQMMNPYAAPGGPFGQPWQSSTAPNFAPPSMVAGYAGQTPANAPTAGFGFVASSMGCGSTAAGQSQSRPMASNQASSFDPFDPFAPDPISVHG